MKRFVSLKISSVLAIMVVLSSCSSVYYGPNQHNTPLFQEKGEIRAAAALTIGEDAPPALEMQGAYAATEQIGVIANFYKTLEGSDRGTYFEGGAGYFTAFNLPFIFEAYGGLGYGSVINDNIERTNFTKFFAQPGIGVSANFLEFCISTRFGFVTYGTIQYDGKDYDPANPLFPYSLQQLHDNPTAFLIEPAATLRFGWKQFKLQAQVGLSKSLTNDYLHMQELNIGVGLYFSFADRFRN